MITSQLNQRISFYRLVNTSDGAGGSYPLPVIYWADTYASVKDKAQKRTNEAGNLILENGIEFTLRFRGDKTVLVNDILKYRRQSFIIRSVELDYVSKVQIVVFAVSNGKTFDDETT